ncbi:MAG: choice-of-anchor D domain-containing protein, partial [Planctomycetaceae bacterium]
MIENTGGDVLEVDFSVRAAGSQGLAAAAAERAQYPSHYYGLEVAKGEGDPRQGRPVAAGVGGPDQFGYSWIDSDEPGGPLFDYRDISSTGNLVAGLEDDNHVGPLRIGFSFPFYGNEYVEFYIQSNGLIGFDDEYIDLANQPIPLPDGYDNIIAWMWDDMYPHSETSVYFETIGNDLIVQFVNYGECCETTPRVDAQVILSANGKIRLQYLEFLDGIGTEDATVGIENGSGTDGLEVAFNTPYLHDQLALEFAPLKRFVRVNPAHLAIDPGTTGSAAVIFESDRLPVGLHEQQIVVITNDPQTPEQGIPVDLTVIGDPDIAALPAALVFGDVFLGATAELVVEVENAGADVLHVSDMATTLADFSVGTASLSFDLPPLESVLLTVVFTPSTTGAITADLVITSDDPDEGTLNVSLEGTGVPAPVITATPSSLSAVLSSGETSSRALNIANDGASDLSFEVEIDDVLAAQTAAARADYPVYYYGLEVAKGVADSRQGRPVAAGVGGPDQFGYSWIDSD